jgi:hypothetical protein
MTKQEIYKKYVDEMVDRLKEDFSLKENSHLQWFRGELYAYASQVIENGYARQTNEKEIEKIIARFCLGIGPKFADNEVSEHLSDIEGFNDLIHVALRYFCKVVSRSIEEIPEFWEMYGVKKFDESLLRYTN